jgi:hypothetical protein
MCISYTSDFLTFLSHTHMFCRSQIRYYMPRCSSLLQLHSGSITLICLTLPVCHVFRNKREN